MLEKFKDTSEYLGRVLGYIHSDISEISDAEKEKITKETVDHFDNYVSPGWLKYRKSVSTNAAMLEWQDHDSNVTDLYGNDFIDCLGGFGIYTCGHKNKEIVETVKAQLDHQALHSQELLDPLRGYLAKAVAQITPGDLQYCFFTNGGAEANEMALKLARVATGGRWYVSTVNAFHGKSMGAVSMGGKDTYRIPYTPMVQQVIHVEYGNAEDARKAIKNLIAVGEKVAAFIVEPVQGEAGIIIPPKGYLKEIRAICDEYGVAMICDEIQTGMGRTGHMWRCEGEDVVPDILTFGKAFGGGIMPITGLICRPPMWTVCCSAAIATIKYMIDHDIPGECAKKGALIKEGLDKLAAKYPDLIDEVRGIGLMLAMEFKTSEIGYQVATGMFSRKVITAGTLVNAKCIRFEPASVITEEQIAQVLQRLDESLADTRAAQK